MARGSSERSPMIEIMIGIATVRLRLGSMPATLAAVLRAVKAAT